MAQLVFEKLEASDEGDKNPRSFAPTTRIRSTARARHEEVEKSSGVSAERQRDSAEFEPFKHESSGVPVVKKPRSPERWCRR